MTLDSHLTLLEDLVRSLEKEAETLAAAIRARKLETIRQAAARAFAHAGQADEEAIDRLVQRASQASIAPSATNTQAQEVVAK